jgi:hypothetical protein
MQQISSHLLSNMLCNNISNYLSLFSHMLQFGLFLSSKFSVMYVME